MKAFKLIFAVLVIFLAGMAAGSSAAGLRWKARAKKEVERREFASSPMWFRLESLRRIQRDLDLSSEQQDRIEDYVRESQDRFRKLWEPVAPQARMEFEAMRERIRAELTPAQREKFEHMLRDRGRRGDGRGDGRDRKPGEEGNRPPRPSSDGSPPGPPKPSDR